MNQFYKIDGSPKHNEDLELSYPDLSKFEIYTKYEDLKSNYYYNKFLSKNLEKMKAAVNMGYNYIFIINKNYSVFNYQRTLQ